MKIVPDPFFPRVFIGLGSNEGDRLRNLSEAVRLLQATQGIRVVQMATIIETDPLGGPPQDAYLNTVVEMETELEPDRLLKMLHVIERQLGRVRPAAHWAPRPIDLDLLLYGGRVIEEPGLSVPHPRLHVRAFVLDPLAQLAPDLIHPVLHRTISELARCGSSIAAS